MLVFRETLSIQRSEIRGPTRWSAEWHRRPSREDTRKMRVPHQTASLLWVLGEWSIFLVSPFSTISQGNCSRQSRRTGTVFIPAARTPAVGGLSFIERIISGGRQFSHYLSFFLVKHPPTQQTAFSATRTFGIRICHSCLSMNRRHSTETMVPAIL